MTKRIRVEFWENNSGGFYRLGVRQWAALFEAGWEFIGQKTVVKEFDSVLAAKFDWEEATGLYAEEEGCSCCGRPFQFYEVQDD